MSAITKYDDEAARIMRDPVLWTEKHIGQKPRWYQEQILRHPHNRIVLRCGRRVRWRVSAAPIWPERVQEPDGLLQRDARADSARARARCCVARGACAQWRSRRLRRRRR